MDLVQIMMSTYNGEKYLEEQIDSILSQKDVQVRLMIRDDGSTDGTLFVLKKYEGLSNVKIVAGVNVGYRRSFLWLLDHCEEAPYYAFADQDDVWQENKLSSAIKMIQNDDLNCSILYTSSLTYVDENLQFLKEQNFPRLKLDLYSEFVRHRFAGCTYVFNDTLRKTCVGTSCIDGFYHSHDAFLALMCWLSGGKVIFDKSSHIFFRRHGDNESVAGRGIVGRIKHELDPFTKYRKYKSNTFKKINQYFIDRVSTENRQFVNLVATYDTNIKNRFKLVCDPRLDCNIRISNLIFKASILFKCM